ncbi:hypothetical protein GCK32_018753 [Trichostrongylus colubriformis]|uniref:Uncharacterized protein n=1 Tax=Trichostrongylus colubriformis TaxID=6319 RepID=A0AAN8FEQ0_TRICO
MNPKDGETTDEIDRPILTTTVLCTIIQQKPAITRQALSTNVIVLAVVSSPRRSYAMLKEKTLANASL